MFDKMRSFLINQDIYGYAIGVHFKGKGTFNTGLGGLCTIATYVLIALNFKVLFEGLLDQSLQGETVQVNSYDNFKTDKYLFSENDLEFVLLSAIPLPRNIGQYKIYQQLGGNVGYDPTSKIEILP